MKKSLVFLLICLLSLFLCCTALADGGTCGKTLSDNVTWDLTDGMLRISGTGDMENYSEAIAAPW